MPDNSKYDFSGNDALAQRQAIAGPDQDATIRHLPGATSLAHDLGADTSDFSRGIVQGATFGGAPVIAGGAEALGDMLTGKEGSFLENYRKHQQESQAAFDAAHQRSPVLYRTGNVAGALGAGIATAGLLPEAGAATAGGRMLEAGLTGAGFGGVSGALESKGNLDTSEGRNQMAKDALGGAVTGAVVAPVIQGVAEYTSPLLDKAKNLLGVEDSDKVRQILQGWKEGREGTAWNSGAKAKSMMGEQQLSDVEGVTKNLLNARNIVSQEFGNTVDSATNAGVTLDIAPPVQTAIDKIEALVDSGKSLVDPNKAKAAIKLLQSGIGNPETTSSGLVDAMGKPLSSGLTQIDPTTPSNAHDFIGMLRNFSSKLEDKSDGDLRNILFGVQDDVKDSLIKAVPDLEPLYDQMYKLSSGTTETLIGKGLDSDLNNVWTGNLNDKEGKLAAAVKRVLQSSESPGSTTAESAATLDRMINNLKAMEEDHPSFLEKIGIDPDTFRKDLQTSADKFAMQKSLTGSALSENAKPSLWSLLGGANTGKGQLINKANMAGRMYGKVFGAGPTANISREFYNLPEEDYSTMAQGLKSIPGLQNLGIALERGITDKNEHLKNAALFSILQNPKARLLFTGDENGQQ